jgi:putative ABC transport system ATP-binding protein
MNKIISIRNLRHSYGRNNLSRSILTDINMDIFSGEIVILMGPSGSGKTTLLTLIGALRSVQEGSLQFLGYEFNQASKKKLIKARQRIGFIFQAHNLLDCLTAWENVNMSLKLNPSLSLQERHSRSIEILTEVGLGSHVNEYPSSLSGGQKQRVAISRALVNNPKLVLADEPTASLDSKTGRDVVEIMRRLTQKDGCAMLLVTHDDRILDLADRILQMEDGILIHERSSSSFRKIH